jgi:signal transduction protein with GAF and PtsI domain
MSLDTLPAAVERALAAAGPAPANLQAAVETIATEFAARTATLHLADTAAQRLHMIAQRGIPEHLTAITREIPFGKGMAGLCAERRAPVSVCNVQSDASGQSRPGAKETGVAGAIVVPVEESGRLVGVLGIGKSEEHEYSAAEQQALAACARHLAPVLRALDRRTVS